MLSMTFFTFSLMMPSHYEGSGEFPEILDKGRTIVEQGILGLAEKTTGGKERSATLSTSRDHKNSQARAVFKGLRVARYRPSRARYRIASSDSMKE
jgi:hypothetical protein